MRAPIVEGAIPEHPILFTTDMVLALLDGTKTETRRVIKLPPGQWELDEFDVPEPGEALFNEVGPAPNAWKRVKCPYGKPGDRLWVRETWVQSGQGIGTPRHANPDLGPIIYRASPEFADMSKSDFAWDWFPSIYMPRWAARLTPLVTGIKAEQLRDISHQSTVAEMGRVPCPEHDFDGGFCLGACTAQIRAQRKAWIDLWNSINAKPRPVMGKDKKIASYVSYPWEDIRETRTHRGKAWHVIGNPPVWAISMEGK